MKRSEQIYNKVIEAMQEADEIEGVESSREYQDLMQRIENTARVRFYNSVDTQLDSKKPTRSEMVDKLVDYEYKWVMNRLDENQHLYDLLKDGFEGFANFSDKKLVACYNDRFGED